MGTLQAHIRLDVSLNIPYALLPGDPARIDHIARHLENVTELAYNREFRSISGTYKGVQVLAVSTGIGGASMGIALEELHGCGVQCAIRIGSCGALQHDIAPGQLVLAEGAVRDDGASAAYLPLELPGRGRPSAAGVLLSGGAGAGLWPLLRPCTQPRQLLYG